VCHNRVCAIIESLSLSPRYDSLSLSLNIVESLSINIDSVCMYMSLERDSTIFSTYIEREEIYMHTHTGADEAAVETGVSAVWCIRRALSLYMQGSFVVCVGLFCCV